MNDLNLSSAEVEDAQTYAGIYAAFEATEPTFDADLAAAEIELAKEDDWTTDRVEQAKQNWLKIQTAILADKPDDEDHTPETGTEPMTKAELIAETEPVTEPVITLVDQEAIVNALEAELGGIDDTLPEYAAKKAEWQAAVRKMNAMEAVLTKPVTDKPKRAKINRDGSPSKIRAPKSTWASMPENAKQYAKQAFASPIFKKDGSINYTGTRKLGHTATDCTAKTDNGKAFWKLVELYKTDRAQFDKIMTE